MPETIEKFGWKENPFILKIDPKLFTGYEDQIRAALRHIENKHKIALVTGATGSGKTTFLKWLELNYDASKLYISKPPPNPEEFVPLFTGIFGFGLIEKLFRKKPSLQTLPSYINSKLKGNHLVFLVDEAHEANKDVLEWLRVLTDQIESVSLVVAGLPSLQDKLRAELETFDQRITTRINLTSLSESETRELIRKRIEAAGGVNIHPFTDSAIAKIYSNTGGFPREVLKQCDRLLNTALDKNLNIIDSNLIEEHKEIEIPEEKVEEAKVTFMPRPPSEEQVRNLPYKQRKILELLSQKDWLTPTTIVEDLEFKSYKSKGHAIRSINNILHRLMLDGFVQREARGKAFMYALTPKVKTLFVKA
jgi:type II secretory pathway predicted ATPase ExeA